jgi:hypothetical protein
MQIHNSLRPFCVLRRLCGELAFKLGALSLLFAAILLQLLI